MTHAGVKEDARHHMRPCLRPCVPSALTESKLRDALQWHNSSAVEQNALVQGEIIPFFEPRLARGVVDHGSCCHICNHENQSSA